MNIEKIKKITKYVVNGLNIASAFIVGLSPIWGWQTTKIVETLSVICGVLSTYILGQKITRIVNEAVGKAK